MKKLLLLLLASCNLNSLGLDSNTGEYTAEVRSIAYENAETYRGTEDIIIMCDKEPRIKLFPTFKIVHCTLLYPNGNSKELACSMIAGEGCKEPSY